MKELAENITNWLKDYANTNKISSFVIGVSGGVDSALVSTLCAKTGLPTFVVSMPIHRNQDQLTRALFHSKWLTGNYGNVGFIDKDLTEMYEITKSTMGKFNTELGLANTRSRLRMIALYQIATAVKGIVVGTGNKVEDFGVGFFTKYGDGGVDISPIGNLTKTEVREMAKVLGIHHSIVDAIPTDGLWEDDRSDEDQIGASYGELEWAMDYIAKDPTEREEVTVRQYEVLGIYNKFNNANKHKMVPIPVYTR